MIDIREYFLEAIAEAKKPHSERGAILHCCAIPSDWFNGKHPKKANLEEEVKKMSEDELKLQLALFLMSCYMQR